MPIDDQSGKNPYLSFPAKKSEKDLLFNLARETIAIHGIEVWYIRNDYVNVDKLFGEDRQPVLDNATKIVMLLNNAKDGTAGSIMYTKYGFSDHTTVSLSISIKEWYNHFPVKSRPNEGDILFIPDWGEWGPSDLYKITFVDKSAIGGYFPLGEKFAFELEAEKWNYASEHLKTGIASLDISEDGQSNDEAVNPNLSAEDIADNAKVQEMGNAFVSFSEKNPFGNP